MLRLSTRTMVIGVVSALSMSTLMVTAPAAEATPLGPPPVEDMPAGSSAGDGTATLLPARPRASTAEPMIEVGSKTSPITPGLRLTEFDRLTAGGWIRGDVLTADLSQPGLTPEYLHTGSASGGTPLSQQAARKGAVAGVNGDFFDIDATGAPLGVGVDNGRVMNAPGSGHNFTAAVSGGPQRVGQLMELFLDTKITRRDGSVLPANDLNVPKVSPGGIAVYTPFWGPSSRKTAVEGARRVTEVELINGVVTRVGSAPAEGPVPGGGIRLLGVDAGADALASMATGERVSVEYKPRSGGALPQAAVGGNKVLLRDGRIQPVDNTALHPRTAAGFSADGKRMWLATVDGRQGDSRGMTEQELAEHMKALGADNAINLDGGGSSTMLAREEGDRAAGVHNSPSDGEERPVPNGIGFAAAPGSGRLTGFRVQPLTEAEHSERVLSGLTRQVAAYGHDETGAPVGGNPQWTVTPGERGHVAQQNGVGVFHAAQPGEARVGANKTGATGETRLDVLGPPVRLNTGIEQLRLPGNGSSGHFQVRGFDANGFSTWVEPADVQLEYDTRALRISPDRDGFAVTALVPGAAVAVTAHAGGLSTRLGVTVGSHPQRLSPLDGADGWHASVYPEPVRASLSDAEGHDAKPGLALNYSLTGTNATRAAYVNADEPITLPAGTQKVGAWVRGDGRGGRLRFTVVDGSGVASAVDLAPKVNWTGWRYVEGAIPAGITGPVSLQRLYVVETDSSRQYDGSLVLDDLTAAVAPSVDLPPQPEPQDPKVVQDATLPAAPGANRIAVVSDAQFTADDPDGPLVQAARRSLREALAAKPDTIVINGDFVDRGTAADFGLARQVISSEIGDRVPWVYVPGNHETSGGTLNEFTAEFGQPFRVVDSRGTRQVFLDSSLGSLRAGGMDQIAMLRRALDSAATDPAITSVAVFMHHPIDDPAPGDASELSDPKEAAMLAGWLGDFERSSHKPAASVAAHAGMFHASTVDGVGHFVNGNAGKSPAAHPMNGGFNGSSLLRIDPRDSTPVRWETRPYVDDLRLDVPEQVTQATQQPVRSELVQGDRVVPVAYPVSEEWRGSPEVFIGSPAHADASKVAAFDPATGMLTGLRPGEAELSVVVNGVKRTARFSVT